MFSIAKGILLLTLFLSASYAMQPFVNPVKRRIIPGKIVIRTKRFAELPRIDGKPAKIVGIVSFHRNLYVTTSTAGGLIYKVNHLGQVMLWLNVSNAVWRKTGRKINMENRRHGGVRGIAFHPNYNRNGLFYVSAMEDRPKQPWKFRYLSKVKRRTKQIGADSVVIEFKYNKFNPKNTWKSYRNVIRIEIPEYDHPIKQITFHGRNLLIGHGDGAVQSGWSGGGLNNDGLGKIIRINPLKNGNKPYTIPRDNPFVQSTNYLGELFAIGFRNPHNICVSNRHGIFVTDTGRDNVEEINIIKAGGNYGWSKREGTFVHLPNGNGTGIGVGVQHLPANDNKNFVYPNAQVGHHARKGSKFVGIALAGACPIDNGSDLDGAFLYANFPTDGAVFYSWTVDMKKAVVRGLPRQLTPAKTYSAKIIYDHDSNTKTPAKLLNNLRDVVIMDGWQNAERVDMRFGCGAKGEIYWSSKTNGRIYVITNSIKRKK